MGFLKAIGNSSTQNTGSQIAIADWQQAFDFVGNKSAILLSEINIENQKNKDTTNQIQTLKRQLANLGKTQKDTVTGYVTITANTAQTISLDMNYFMENADWEVNVTSKFNTENNNITVISNASVEQYTSEDWSDISLTLSNSNDFGDFGNIDQDSDILILTDKSPSRGLISSAPRFERKLIAQDAVEEVVVTGSRIRSSNSKFDRNYILPNKITLSSSSDAEEINIATTIAPTKTVIRAIPYRDDTAYVFADTIFPEIETIQHIDATLYRDGHYIGTNEWPHLIKDTKLQLPFGSDQQIQIDYTEQPPHDDEKGVFSKSNIEEKRVIISDTNNHNTPQTIEIFDRMPVSGHKDISVKPIKGATKPTETNMNNQQGLMMWRKTLQPNEKWEIKHQYRIAYPSDKALRHS